MIHDCRKCKFFRRDRPKSQLLGHELEVTEQQVANQLISILQDEFRVQGDEDQRLVELMIQYESSKLSDGEAKWDRRPERADYCGLREEAQIYLIYQIKNRDGHCGDFTEDPGVRRPCATCVHRRRGDGKVKDKEAIDEYRRLAANSAALGQGGGDHGLASYLERVGAVKAFEAAQSYYVGKLSLRPPAYLDTCGLYSKATEQEFIPCIVQNPHDACPGWEEVAKTEDEEISILLNLEKFRKSTSQNRP
jgi:hypothetical protein